MILYLSGPMSQIKDLNFPEFQQQQERLQNVGYTVYSPHTWGNPEWTWNENMRTSLLYLLQCNGVAVLCGWHRSRGAVLEVSLAGSLRIPAKPVNRWMEDAENGTV